MSAPTMCCLVAVLACAQIVSASSFLSRAHVASEEFTLELQSSITEEIEAMFGDNHSAMQGRLERIEDMLRTTFQAMPKNEEGKLHHAAVRYTLHSYFLQRHGWFIRGLSTAGEVSTESSPTGILQDRVEEFVHQAFEKRLGANGLDLREMAALVATYENLVHREAMQRLNATFLEVGVNTMGELPLEQVDKVLDTYMIGYLLGIDLSKLSPSMMGIIESKIDIVLPSWNNTRSFLREVRSKTSFHRSFFNRADVERMIEDVGDEYGRWQDKECRDLKQRLLALEDTSIGTNGSGRVRIADFYGSALSDGNWQFSESVEYLTKLGALDTYDPENPRVIIANYINSPSNCLAGSKFYSVCCISECEDLMERIEHHFAAPTASPAEIIEFVEALASSSVSAGRKLPAILPARLEDIAKRHNGSVPLHGRMFAQWMHHAYPRECQYPHMSGVTSPQIAIEYLKQMEKAPTVSKADMEKIVAASAGTQGAEQKGIHDITGWSDEEELYVGGALSLQKELTLQTQRGTRKARRGTSEVSNLVRDFAYLTLAAFAAFGLLWRVIDGSKDVAKVLGPVGKQHFV